MTTSFLDRGEGRIAYEVQGDGPLVVLLPGMGVDRSVYRFTVPALVAAGFRVAPMDLRGHGESDTTFATYDDPAAASDALALVDHIGGPALLVGNSMGAGAAVIAAARRPSAVAGTVLIGPWVRDSGGALADLLMRALLLRPWGPAAWRSYYRSLYPTRRPADFADHERRMGASLRRKWRAFARTARTSHTPARDRLADVAAPTLVVMGTKDRDWPDPAGEARFVAGALHAELVLVDGAGHYPMAEFPEIVNPPLVAFARRVLTRG
ncbi:MAG TPA: alpha/beta hydrolase [Micromonosporaceae bacterium]|jgi:pimeloyl-ACP methyl ester carboxylesterase